MVITPHDDTERLQNTTGLVSLSFSITTYHTTNHSSDTTIQAFQAHPLSLEESQIYFTPNNTTTANYPTLLITNLMTYSIPHPMEHGWI